MAICQDELPYKLDAYREIVRRYESIVYNPSVKMIGSVPDAEEVCQDAFLRVFHKLHQFEGRSAFKTWFVSNRLQSLPDSPETTGNAKGPRGRKH